MSEPTELELNLSQIMRAVSRYRETLDVINQEVFRKHGCLLAARPNEEVCFVYGWDDDAQWNKLFESTSFVECLKFALNHKGQEVIYSFDYLRYRDYEG